MDLIQSVRESYDRCCANGDFPTTFYDIFLTKSPEIAKLFADTDFTQQKRHLRAALLILIKYEPGDEPTRIYKLDTDGGEISSFSISAMRPTGLAWDGENLWVSDTLNLTISQVTQTGQVLTTFASPCEDPLDLAWDGENLWVLDAWGTDGEGNILYKVDPAGTVLKSVGVP